jgi:hypothetical protein
LPPIQCSMEARAAGRDLSGAFMAGVPRKTGPV